MVNNNQCYCMHFTDEMLKTKVWVVCLHVKVSRPQVCLGIVVPDFPLLFWIFITRGLTHVRKNYHFKFMFGHSTFLREGGRTMNKLSVDAVTTYRQSCWGHYKVRRTVNWEKIYWSSGWPASGKELSSPLKPHTMQNCIRFFIVSSLPFPSWMENAYRSFSHPPPLPAWWIIWNSLRALPMELHKEILYK